MKEIWNFRGTVLIAALAPLGMPVAFAPSARAQAQASAKRCVPGGAK